MARRQDLWSRRRLLAVGASAGLTGALAACSSSIRLTTPTGTGSRSATLSSTSTTQSNSAPLAAATSSTVSSTAAGQGPVRVLYAGSLTNLMEKTLGPAFDAASGYSFQGEGKGSQALANLIKGKARAADVFISADPTVNATLMGPTNGSVVTWFLTMARTELVIAWSDKSRFAPDFDAARNGKKPWYGVLEEQGLRLGRTDPQLDPKGYRTVWLFDLAEQFYHQPGLRESILGADGNQSQVFPEETLVARLQSGQLDAGVFYLIEAEEARLPYVTLPAAINQGDPAYAAAYARETFTDSHGVMYHGSPILYTITVPDTRRNPVGAVAFVHYALGPAGQAILDHHGLLATPVQAGGDVSAVPAPLRSLVTGPYAPAT